MGIRDMALGNLSGDPHGQSSAMCGNREVIKLVTVVRTLTSVVVLLSLPKQNLKCPITASPTWDVFLSRLYHLFSERQYTVERTQEVLDLYPSFATYNENFV